MTALTLSLILLTVTLSAFAQLALKMGMSSDRMQFALQGSTQEIAFAVIFSPLIWVGLFIYVLSVGLWLWVLSKVELSVAYPFVGISFLVTMAFGIYILNENVTSARIVGTLLVSVGCVLIARSS